MRCRLNLEWLLGYGRLGTLGCDSPGRRVCPIAPWGGKIRALAQWSTWPWCGRHWTNRCQVEGCHQKTTRPRRSSSRLLQHEPLSSFSSVETRFLASRSFSSLFQCGYHRSGTRHMARISLRGQEHCAGENGKYRSPKQSLQSTIDHSIHPMHTAQSLISGIVIEPDGPHERQSYANGSRWQRLL
jgi:hypothetical protein